MSITASLALGAVIVHLNVTLILLAAEQTMDITCHVVTLVVPRVVTLLPTIRWIVRMLARIPTVLQATPRMRPTNLATSLGMSCLVANKWRTVPSWIASKVATAAPRNRSPCQWIPA